jgi:hypothetical protein
MPSGIYMMAEIISLSFLDVRLRCDYLVAHVGFVI